MQKPKIRQEKMGLYHILAISIGKLQKPECGELDRLCRTNGNCIGTGEENVINAG